MANLSKVSSRPLVVFDRRELAKALHKRPKDLDSLYLDSEAIEEILLDVTIPERMVLSTREAARLLGLSIRALERATERGEIPAVEIDGRRLYLRDSIERELQRREGTR